MACDPISTTLPSYQAVPEAPVEQLDHHQHHGTKCACALLFCQNLLVTLMCCGMCILTNLTCDKVLFLTVEGSWDAWQLAFKTCWQCVENCGEMYGLYDVLPQVCVPMVL